MNLSIPVQSKELEKQILGIVKIDQDVIDEYNITDDLFFIETHKKIFNLMKLIHDKGIKIDDIVLNENLKLTDLTNISYIVSLSAMTSGNAKYYIDQQKELMKLEKIRLLSLNINDWLKAMPADEIIQQIDEQITNINKSDNNKLIWAKDRIYEVINNIEKVYRSNGALKGLSSGYTNFDNYTNGFQKQNMIIIGARASTGKSALMLNIISNMITQKIKVGLFTLETFCDEVLLRMVLSDSRINLGRLKTGKAKGSEFENINNIAQKILDSYLLIDETPNIQLSKLKANARSMKRQGIEIIFIDYFTLIRWGDLRMDKISAMGEISKSIKNLARELDIPIIVLSQLNREAEGKKPTLANIRQTGEIEEDGDVIVFIYREREKNETKIIFAKNRNGATGEIDMYFTPEYTRFNEVLQQENKSGYKNYYDE